jgi:hypothetical protein
MLSRILKEFYESGGAVNLNELSCRLGVERSALDGMLETLVRQGKLREVGAVTGTGSCHCGSGSCHCGENAGKAIGKSYELVAN